MRVAQAVPSANPQIVVPGMRAHGLFQFQQHVQVFHPAAAFEDAIQNLAHPGGRLRGSPRCDEISEGAVRELGLDPGELRREAMKLAAVRLFRIGRSRGRPRDPRRLPAVDGPVAKSPTRDRVNWLAAHERACFLSETGGGHSVVSWMESVGGGGGVSVSHRRSMDCGDIKIFLSKWTTAWGVLSVRPLDRHFVFRALSARPVESGSHILPVPQVPDRVEELGLSGLVLEVEGVLPRVQHEQGSARLGQIRLVVVDLRDEQLPPQTAPRRARPSPSP